MARITRQDLKTDDFAVKVEAGLSFFEQHQEKVKKYGGIAVALVAVIIIGVIYMRHQTAAREDALARAIEVQEAPVGASSTGGLAFPTQDAKDQEAIRVFTALENSYSGSTEGEIARYYLGAIHADQGKMAAAEKDFQSAAQKGNAQYSSLAKLSLAQIYFSDGRDTQGEATLRDLIAHPTLYVSADQATITLARFLAAKKPAEARKLLDPLRTKSGPVSQVAITLYSELPSQ